MSVQWTVTVDCAHPATLAAFWSLALGYVEARPPNGFTSWAEWLADAGVPREEWDDVAYIEDPDGMRPSISFLKVPEPKVVKNRVHLDVQVGGPAPPMGGPMAAGHRGSRASHRHWRDFSP